jgi:hypothetical protein
MQFKTKDLLVTVLPKAEISKEELAKLCFLRTMFCLHPTYHFCSPCTVRITWECGWCTRHTIPCPALTCAVCSMHGTIDCGASICAVGSGDPHVIKSPEDLATLKTELEATLKSLDSIEKEGLTPSIASKKDAEALERSLSEALEQVRAAKKNL